MFHLWFRAPQAVAAMKDIAAIINEDKRNWEQLPMIQDDIGNWIGPDLIETSSMLVRNRSPLLDSSPIPSLYVLPFSPLLCRSCSAARPPVFFLSRLPFLSRARFLSLSTSVSVSLSLSLSLSLFLSRSLRLRALPCPKQRGGQNARMICSSMRRRVFPKMPIEEQPHQKKTQEDRTGCMGGGGGGGAK